MTLREFLQGFLHSRSRLRDEMDLVEKAVSAMSVQGARDRVLPLLDDPRRYRAERRRPSTREKESLAHLTPTTRSLYDEFARIEEIYGDTVLSRSLIGPSVLLPNLDVTRIGTAVDGTELVAEPSEDAIYRIDGSESDMREMDRFPSVWHYLVHMAMLIYPDAIGPEEEGD